MLKENPMPTRTIFGEDAWKSSCVKTFGKVLLIQGIALGLVGLCWK